MRKNRQLLLTAAVVGLTGLTVSAQVTPFAVTGNTYSQNFNTLGGSNITVPNTAQISQLPGWVIRSQNNQTPVLNAGTGASNAGGLWNVGSDATDRALGSIGSGNATNGGPFNYGVVLLNSSATNFTSIDLSFYIEQWRYGGASANENSAFSYGVVTDVPAASTFPSLSLTSSSSLSQGIINTTSGNGAGNANKVQKTATLSVGWNIGSYLVLRWTDQDSAGNDSVLAVDDVTLTATGPNPNNPKNITWAGTTNSQWDTTTDNWSGESTKFSQYTSPTAGDIVTFDGTAQGTINLPGNVTPNSVTIISGNYTFAGPGAINSTGAITISSGTTTTATNISANGGIVVSNGATLAVTTDDNLASNASLSLDNGTLSILGSSNASNTRQITAQSGGATVSVATGVTATINSVTGSNAFVKSGDGTLKIPTSFSLTGPVSITAGTLEIGLNGTVGINGQAGGFIGNLNLPKTTRFNATGEFSGGGLITLGDSSTVLTELNAPTGSGNVTIGNTITTGSGVANFNISANSGNTLKIGAVNAGAANVTFGIVQGSSTSGAVVVNQSLTYTGQTIIKGTGNASVTLKGNDLLPVTTPLVFSNNTTVTLPTSTVFLEGNSQTVRSIATVNNAIGGSIVGDSGSVLTINGQSGDDTTFAGNIRNALSVIKSGPSIQTFTGSVTFSGGLTVNDGKLVIGTSTTTAGSQTVLNVASLALNGGTIQIAPRDNGAGKLVIANTLTTAGGFLDLTDNNAVFTGSSLAAVSGAVDSWFSDGARNGAGIGSSLATINTLTTIGVAQNDDGAGNVLVGAISGSTSDVIAKYTYLGDTDLNGFVDTTDLNRVIAGISQGLTGWFNGDTNYDGVVDSVDFANVLTSLRYQGAPLSETPGTTGVIPEPAMLGLAVLGMPMLSRRRR